MEIDLAPSGNQERLGVCCSLSMSRLMCFVYPGVVKSYTLTVFRPLKSCSGGYSASSGYRRIQC